MTTAVIAAAPRAAVTGKRQPRETRRLFADLMAVAPPIRREFVAGLSGVDLSAVLAVAAAEGGTPYCLWRDDPVGFVEDVLGESTWSRQRAVLESVAVHKLTAVPSGYGTGKTHIAARVLLWGCMVHPPGTSLTVTTATRFRQVARQLWPHVRTCAARAGLPITVDQTQAKMSTPDGVEVVVAYGFSAAPHDEAAAQGIHHSRLMVIVDEAGGISRTVGAGLRGLMTGDDTKLLAIGNPPTDDEHSWFEDLCAAPGSNVVEIPATSSPNLSAEEAPRCLACPDAVPAHSLARHLVDEDWVTETIRVYGAEAPYSVAKVDAKFPRGGAARVIPSAWIDAGMDAAEPEPGTGWVRLVDLGLDDEADEWMVARGAWVRLGVDVAADGGDEFVIARCVGTLITEEHVSSGSVNTNAVDVAGKVLTQIRRAEVLRRALATNAPVRVKVDSIGLGWGVAGILEAWASEGLHSAEIVRVDVAEGTGRDDETATLKPYRKRDELWLSMRSLLAPPRRAAGEQPGPESGVRLRVSRLAAGQLATPKMGTSTSGHTVIESKKAMRARGVSSPDRAEAVCLAVYEPAPVKKKPGKVRVMGSLPQTVDVDHPGGRYE